MGEVYRAHDPRLNRDVALKLLRAEFAADADRLQRFVREAQTLAALNHPHIAQIHGVEDGTPGETGQPVRGLVMEFVDGEDLSARLARGRVPLDECFDIARQVAEALEAAHEQGVVHRDLKPANVKIRPDGIVKVLDFGLAKLSSSTSSGAAPLADSPTFMSPNHALTSANIILGTAAYMSPEQARGKYVDKRADIWSFGVVLYEMLAGRPAYQGDTVTDLMAAVVTRDPDWSALPGALPAPIRQLLRRCLEKDPRNRLRDIGEARFVLVNPAAVDTSPIASDPSIPPASRARLLPWVIAALAVVTGAAAWISRPPTEAPVRKLELAIPADANATTVTLSPDGRHIGYRAGDRVVAIDLETAQARDLATAAQAQRTALFWSPDSTFVGYSDADAKLWIVPVAGGAARLVSTIPETGQLMGVAWATTGTITFTVWRGSLYQVPSSGGQPTALAVIDPKREIDFHLPVALPDGRVLVATHLLGSGNGSQQPSYRVEAIGERQRDVALDADFMPIGFVDGYVLLQRLDVNPGLWAIPYSRRLPLRVEDGFLIAAGAGFSTTSDNGSILYSLASSVPQLRELVWVDREGRIVSSIGSELVDIFKPALSPDGRRIAFSARLRDNVDIWVRDLESLVDTRVTTDAGEQGWPSWFPSGLRVAYSELGTIGSSRIAASNADGSGGRNELVRGLTPVIAPDGKHVVYTIDERGDSHLRYAAISADGEATAGDAVFKRAPEPSIHGADFSPDGGHLAYAERAPGGAMELFLTSFPSGAGRWQVAGGGARSPVWTANGELFFVGGANDGPKTMMSATIGAGNPPRIGSPVQLFDIGSEIEISPRGLSFDASPDGKRFVMIRSRRTASQLSPIRWVLVQNWLSEFRSRP